MSSPETSRPRDDRGAGGAGRAYVMVVLANPRPGREAEFNAWYDAQHMPQVLQTPGFVSAQRFALAAQPPGDGPVWRYCSTYRVEADDPQAALDALMARFASGQLTPTDAMAESWFAVFEAMGSVVNK
jgi:hypothetical protein